MAKNSWLQILIDLVDTYFKSSRTTKRGKTWHQHVVPYNNGWAVRREGNKRVTSKHRKQSTALRKAKSIAKKHNADVIIHRADGTIRDRISYKE